MLVGTIKVALCLSAVCDSVKSVGSCWICDNMINLCSPVAETSRHIERPYDFLFW